MIIYHQDNIAAFAGGHIFYWIGQPILQSARISITTAAASGIPIPIAIYLYRQRH